MTTSASPARHRAAGARPWRCGALVGRTFVLSVWRGGGGGWLDGGGKSRGRSPRRARDTELDKLFVYIHTHVYGYILGLDRRLVDSLVERRRPCRVGCRLCFRRPPPLLCACGAVRGRKPAGSGAWSAPAALRCWSAARESGAAARRTSAGAGRGQASTATRAPCTNTARPATSRLDPSETDVVRFTALILAMSLGRLKGVPKIVGVGVPCCNASAVEV